VGDEDFAGGGATRMGEDFRQASRNEKGEGIDYALPFEYDIVLRTVMLGRLICSASIAEGIGKGM